MIAIPDSQRRAIVTALTATGGSLNGAKVHLYKNDYTPGPGSRLTDLIEADFTGYAASAALVWGSTFTDELHNAVAAAASVQFNDTGEAVTNTVYGYYVTDGAGAVLLYAERFDSPVPMTGPAQAIVVLPEFSFGQ